MRNGVIPALSGRKDWVDALRALAMLFVIFGHFYRRNFAYFVFSSPIKIPLFFVIGGYVFHYRDGDVKGYLINLFKRIVIPWLFLSFLSVIVYFPTNGWAYVGNAFLEVLTGERVWYMPCYIIAQILFVLSRKLTANFYQLSVVSMLITVVGYILGKFGVLGMFKINTAMICQSYLLLGSLIRSHEGKLQKMKLWMVLAGLAGYIGLAMVSMALFPGKGLDVNNNSYYNIPMCIALIGLGCVSLFAVAPRIKCYPRCIVFIGQNTMVCYIFHQLGRVVVSALLKRMNIILPNTWYAGLGMTVVVCVGCGIFAAILNWLIPQAVGKQRKKVKCE